MYVRSSLRLDSFSKTTACLQTEPMRIMIVWQDLLSARGLNVSLPRRVHPESIELVFYKPSNGTSFSGGFPA